ncbi:alpha-isopropylmalate synthase regulatory domain-containing protein [Cysteiniphilum sp. SYW-8]|nr:alpha-isopropylmalate synthase regulatory domain-containing protein [Cysteiniphilum sp. SYW-8]
MVFVEKDQVLFRDMPNPTQTKEALENLFGANYNDDLIAKVQSCIERFLAKGRAIHISDLQDIVQDAMEMVDITRSDILKVVSFKVTTGQDKIAEAEVTVELNGQLYYASNKGVGPVDAIIQALCKACPSEIQYQLTDYKVQIRGQGADAVVYVEMKLIKGSQNSVGKAVSPDIIQASVEAFIDAYNIAHPV